MTMFQAIMIALVQGVTELFPVSSLGHAVVLPALLGWSIDQKSPEFLPFIVVLHFGTSLALLSYFWRDWLNFARAVISGGGAKSLAERKIFYLIVIATLPGVVIGYTFEHMVRNFFGSPRLAAIFLILNGVMLFLGERIKRSGTKTLDKIGWKAALAIGSCQALALVPGISRSGATIIGGILSGLKHHEAARFSFLLSTPIIIGATLLEVPKLLHATPDQAFHLTTIVMGGVIAGITAWLSIFALMRYFKTHEVEALDPFAWYCWAFGVLALISMW